MSSLLIVAWESHPAPPDRLGASACSPGFWSSRRWTGAREDLGGGEGKYDAPARQCSPFDKSCVSPISVQCNSVQADYVGLRRGKCGTRPLETEKKVLTVRTRTVVGALRFGLLYWKLFEWGSGTTRIVQGITSCKRQSPRQSIAPRVKLRLGTIFCYVSTWKAHFSQIIFLFADQRGCYG